MRCAIYARYSTDNQNEESIDSQVAACQKFIEGEEGWTLAEDRIYMDYAVSGSTMNRLGLDNLMAAAKGKPKPFDKVIVFAKSRLSRNGVNEQLITAEFERLGIDVISASEQFHNMKGSGRKAAEGAMRFINEIYIEQVSENTIRGQDYAASRGFKTTWAPYGYQNKWIPDPNGAIDKKTGQPRQRLIWEIHPEKADVIRWMFAEYLQGNGLKRLTDKLNQKGVAGPRGGTWAPSAIREMLRNSSYIGWYCLGKHRRATWPDGKKTYLDKDKSEWRIYKNVHDAIISQDLFNEVQKRISITAKKYCHFSSAKAEHSRYLLTGLIKCGVCGKNFIVQSTRKKAGDPVQYRHYVCSLRNNRGKSVCANACRINMGALDNEVLKETKRKLLDQNLIDDVLRKADEIVEQARLEAYEIEDLSREKVKLEEGKERLLEYMTMTDMDPDAAQEIGQRLKEHLRQIKEIDNILQIPQRAKEKVARIILPFFGKKKVVVEFVGAQEKSPRNWHSYLKKHVDSLINGFRQCSPAIVRTELKNHIREIVVHQDGTITIHGTSQSILSKAGFVKAGELGTIELGREPAAAKEKAPRQKPRGYTRKDGVPTGI
jgi:site-specific DNA recombinase